MFGVGLGGSYSVGERREEKEEGGAGGGGGGGRSKGFPLIRDLPAEEGGAGGGGRSRSRRKREEQEDQGVDRFQREMGSRLGNASKHLPFCRMHTRLVSNSAPTWLPRCCFTACHF